MGNQLLNGGVRYEDFEYMNGKRLLVAIHGSSKEGIKKAVKQARSECLKHKGTRVLGMEYEEANKQMLLYLTRKYDCCPIIERVTADMTPLEFAEYQKNLTEGSDEVMKEIQMNIDAYKRNESNVSERMQESKDKLKRIQLERDSEVKGVVPPAPHEKKESVRSTVTHDRAIQAKARLQAFQDTKGKK